MSLRRLVPTAAAALLTATLVIAPTPPPAQAQEVLDPAHNIALPCESVSAPGLVPRSARDLQHVANVCGFVGTDLEFQSRVDAGGAIRDYVFLGRSEEHTSELQSRLHLVCRLLLEKK